MLGNTYVCMYNMAVQMTSKAGDLLGPCQFNVLSPDPATGMQRNVFPEPLAKLDCRRRRRIRRSKRDEELVDNFGMLRL